jgi:hypothetical protein
MKKKIIVFALSVILSVIGICASMAYVVELWTRKPGTVENDLYAGLSSIVTAFVSAGLGYISIVFTATALILIIYCIKYCTGVLRTISIALCVLCVLALTASLVSYVIYFIISRNLTELRIPVRFL